MLPILIVYVRAKLTGAKQNKKIQKQVYFSGDRDIISERAKPWNILLNYKDEFMMKLWTKSKNDVMKCVF